MIKFIILAVLAISALGKEIPRNSLPKIRPRIVNGYLAKPGQFPYQVSLRNYINQYICGGILASDRWIVSAAHCTFNRYSYNIFSFVGTILRVKGGDRYSTAKIINHPYYDESTTNYDISLILTTQPITFTKYIRPIALASSYVRAGVRAVVSGWGITSYPDGQCAERLQYLPVTIISNSECKKNVGSLDHMIFDNKICSDGISDRGPCKGDSGGPLAIENVAIGIVSFGDGCANGKADVYERLSSHRNWIIRTFQII